MKKNIISLILIALSLTLLASSCLAGPPKPIVEKFIEKCQTGDWSGAEDLLSERGRLLYAQDTSLHDQYWPILALPMNSGVSAETIKTKFSQLIMIISSDSSTNTAQVRVKINNSEVIDQPHANTIIGQTGLKSIDISVRFDLIEESGRWKIEKISPQGDRVELNKWENFAKTSPSSISGS